MSSLFVDNDGNTNWKKIGYHARSAFAVLLSLAVLIGGGWIAYDKANSAYVSWKTSDDYPGPGGTPVVITIEPESTGSDIANVLLDADIVKSRKAVTKALSSNEKSQSIQAGTYKLPVQIPAADAIAYLLDNQHVVRNQVTIPEGMWLRDAFALLSKRSKIPAAEFTKAAQNPQALGYPSYVKNLEGFLYPETYEMGQKPTATSILKLAAAQYTSVAKSTKIDAGPVGVEGEYTPMDVITIASIIEGEVNNPKDQPIVAGILYNRMRDGWNLQLDSTSHYGLKIPMNKPLPKDFDKIDEPYNTYLHKGLPVGPISSPGESAIKAALHPTKSDYFYWVSTNLKTGETKFAKTLGEHQKNVTEWENYCKSAKDKSGCPTG